VLSVVIDLVWELCCCWPCIVVQAEAALEEKRAVFDESDTDMLQQDQAEVQRLQARLTCVTAHYPCMHLRLTALRGLYQSRIDSHASLSNVVSPVYTVYNALSALNAGRSCRGKFGCGSTPYPHLPWCLCAVSTVASVIRSPTRCLSLPGGRATMCPSPPWARCALCWGGALQREYVRPLCLWPLSEECSAQCSFSSVLRCSFCDV
jgi:hypothetical protein